MSPLLRLACSVLVALSLPAVVHAEMRVVMDTNATERQQAFAVLVQARLTAIAGAFPELVDRAPVGIHVVIQEPIKNQDPPIAHYDANLDTLTFQRVILGYFNDTTILAASDYWAYYEREEMRADFPIIEVIDDVLWKALLSEFAQQSDLTWPPAECQSIDLPRRLGCQMSVAGIDYLVHSRRMRIFNENRLDRLWPSDLTELQARGWQSGDREYQEVRDLGGIELIKPLVEEFGAARVFAYVAQTPFVIQQNDVFKSAVQYQKRAREMLGW